MMRKPQIIVCGLGPTGYEIFRLLRQQGIEAIGIHDHPLPQETDHVIVGNLRSSSTLLAAGIQEAQTLVLAMVDDAVNLAVLVQARLLNPHIRIVNRLFNQRLGERLNNTLTDHTAMSVSALAAPVFAFAAFGNRAIGQLQLFEQIWPIHEEYIYEGHAWAGRTLDELWEDRSRMLIYYLPMQTHLDLVSGVLRQQPLQVGDRLIVATKPTVGARRKSVVERGRQFFRWLKTLRQQIQSSVAVTLVLFTTIFVATLTYTAINAEITMVDALYFSVGMITGAGGNEKVAETAPAVIKVFTVIMMLAGAGVIGIAYALLNDWVLGTSFRKLWQAAPIPSHNHYIICGLGGIGIQIATSLQENGYDVVVIEQDPNGRFLHTAQSLKIPVVQGDATLPNTLESANIQRATALFAVSSDDTTNLEIALTAKGLKNDLRVVVRSRDAHFGMMVQEVFEFNSVLSPTEIAAPSFAAAALGGEIFGSGMTAGNLWIAMATTITAEHPFLGQDVKSAAANGDFVPLYLETPGDTLHGWELLGAELEVGDRLYLTIPANRLAQLWRVVEPELELSPPSTQPSPQPKGRISSASPR
ncbi:potassium channel family protein [Sodalinema gerasimenkoae]|uniref:potassium channel family protein n=1 Tax=Sodalinema gerasimenkoae TaxID=2862348 RepID=UPI001FE51FB9|nr:NAD-binding protein [Sodalinema gerasimenkoae]